MLTLWLAGTGALHHPDYIPYFNELVQGQPDRVLCDSDYDWGQDTKRLAAALKQVGATQLNYGYVNSHDEAFLEAYPGLPRSRAYIRCSPPMAGPRSAPRRTTPLNTAWNIATRTSSPGTPTFR
jgi:hypothetical protein